MFDSALDRVAGYLDRRFFLTALVPMLVFWIAALALASSLVGWSEVLVWVKHRTSVERLTLTIGALAAITFLASLLAAQAGNLIRFYEGYWDFLRCPGRWLRRKGADRQWTQREALDVNDDREFEIRYRAYPRRREDILPTRLGNVLKSAEDYPADSERYELDSVFFWPRLYAVIPETTRCQLDDARSTLDLMVFTSTLASTFAVSSLVPLLAVGSGDLLLWLLPVGGGLVLGRLAYLGAARSAIVYAELVRACFDLYRRDLLVQLGFAPPASLEAERELWRNLGQQLYRRAAEKPEVLRFAQPDSLARRN